MGQQFLEVQEVRTWVNTILDAMEQAGISSMPLDKQYYHTLLGPDEAFDLSKPPGLGVSDLHDDVLDLRNEVQSYGANEGMQLHHALVHLQGVVGFLAVASDGVVAFLNESEEAP